MLTAPTINNEASTTYISHVLFGFELAEGAGFFSGFDGSDIQLVPLKANGIGVNDSISQT